MQNAQSEERSEYDSTGFWLRTGCDRLTVYFFTDFAADIRNVLWFEQLLQRQYYFGISRYDH